MIIFKYFWMNYIDHYYKLSNESRKQRFTGEKDPPHNEKTQFLYWSQRFGWPHYQQNFEDGRLNWTCRIWLLFHCSGKLKWYQSSIINIQIIFFSSFGRPCTLPFFMLTFFQTCYLLGRSNLRIPTFYIFLAPFQKSIEHGHKYFCNNNILSFFHHLCQPNKTNTSNFFPILQYTPISQSILPFPTFFPWNQSQSWNFFYRKDRIYEI